MRSVQRMVIVSSLMGLTACNSLSVKNDLASACETGIQQLTTVLEQAQTTSPPSNPKLHRASLLLSAAQVQQEFAQYPKCVEKVQRAKRYIKSYRQPDGQTHLLTGMLSFGPDLKADR